MKIIGIIPAYNEETMIRSVIESIRPHVHEVVVVDDGSEDNTADFAKSVGAIVLRHHINRGQGAALQSGVELALDRGADILVHFDSDGQHPAHQIPDLIKPLLDKEFDVVLGSRFLDRGSNVPPVRRVVLKLALLFTRAVSGLKITDPQSGFRAMNRKAAKTLRLRQDRMAHASEFLQLLARHKLRYKEIPVTIVYTEYSKAKGQKSWGAIKIVIDLVKGSLF